jgi:hypothetical protein
MKGKRWRERTGDTGLLDVDKVRLEHALGSLEAFGADLDDTTVRKLKTEGNGSFSRTTQEEKGKTHLVVLDKAGGLLAQSLVEVEVVPGKGSKKSQIGLSTVPP